MLPCNLPVWIDCCCSVPQSYPTLCDPMDYSRPASPVLHCLPEFAQTHVHWVDDAIQTSLSPPSPPATNLAQHQGLFQWVCPSHQVARVLELQFHYQSFQWIFSVQAGSALPSMHIVLWLSRGLHAWVPTAGGGGRSGRTRPAPARPFWRGRYRLCIFASFVMKRNKNSLFSSLPPPFFSFPLLPPQGWDVGFAGAPGGSCPKTTHPWTRTPRPEPLTHTPQDPWPDAPGARRGRSSRPGACKSRPDTPSQAARQGVSGSPHRHCLSLGSLGQPPLRDLTLPSPRSRDHSQPLRHTDTLYFVFPEPLSLPPRPTASWGLVLMTSYGEGSRAGGCHPVAGPQPHP